MNKIHYNSPYFELYSIFTPIFLSELGEHTQKHTDTEMLSHYLQKILMVWVALDLKGMFVVEIFIS